MSESAIAVVIGAAAGGVIVLLLTTVINRTMPTPVPRPKPTGRIIPPQGGSGTAPPQGVTLSQEFGKAVYRLHSLDATTGPYHAPLDGNMTTDELQAWAEAHSTGPMTSPVAAAVLRLLEDCAARKYFVDYDYGSCNDGSHDFGWQEYETLDQARGAIKMIAGDIILEDGSATIIHGTIVEEHDAKSDLVRNA